MNTIKIDVERQIGALSRDVFGGFAEHLGRCIYGGIFDEGSPLADEHGFRKDVLEALRRLRLPVIRYPGGNFVSGYRWQDGIGPRDQRPSRLDLAWFDVESNRFGTDEFVQFCRQIGAEPYLAVNCGDGDMREARDWVEYCNGTRDTALAKMRRANGYEAPHGVKFWGIGNEVDGPWQIGMKTPDEYARSFTEYGKLMKWVDPNIKLIASWNSRWHTDWVERGQQILEQAGDLVDYMSIHWYVGNREHDFARYMATAEWAEERLTAAEGLIDAMLYCGHIARPIHLAVDEWNVWYRVHNEGKLEEIYNLEDALVNALQLNAFIRHARTVKMANLAQIVNVIAPIMTRPDGVLLQSIFYPQEIYSQFAGDTALDVYWGGDTFQAGDQPGLRVLDVSATLDEAKGQVAVFVVNRSLDQEAETRITLQTGAFNGLGMAYTVAGDGPEAFNTFDKPDAVKTGSTALTLQGNELTYAFPPCSVTALVFGCR